jgi:hypothetical protein
MGILLWLNELHGLLAVSEVLFDRVAPLTNLHIAEVVSSRGYFAPDKYISKLPFHSSHNISGDTTISSNV